MPVKIFIGNITEGSEESELRELFETHGRVTECDIVSNYAFVHMATESEAQAAIDVLHQSTFNGSQIRCEMSTKHTQGRKKAREEDDEVYGGGGGGGGGGGRGRGGGRGGGRGASRGRGRGGDRFQPYNKGGHDDYPPVERDTSASRDPLRDPFIRDVLLRDPYVRDLIDRELYYRDILTRGDPYEREEYPRESYSARFARESALERDPYVRPPPDYYSRGGEAKPDNGLAAAVRERLAAVQPPRPVPPPGPDDRFNAYGGMGRGGRGRGSLLG